MAQYIPEVQNGAVAYIHGITNNGTPFTMSGYPTFIFNSDDITQQWDKKPKKDSANSTVAIIGTDARYERTVRIEITGATRADAIAKAIFPAVLASITFANLAVAIQNGKWLPEPGVKMMLKFDDELAMEFPLVKFADEAQNNSLNTTITG